MGKFCEVGDVLFADIRAKGTGIVRFSSERDAQRACSLLNRSRMEGRVIEVDFYRSSMRRKREKVVGFDSRFRISFVQFSCVPLVFRKLIRISLNKHERLFSK